MVGSMKTQRIRTVLAKVVAVLAYLSLSFQWLWVLLLSLPMLIDGGAFDMMRTTSDEAVVTPIHIEPLAPSPALTAVLIIVTIMMVALSLFALWRIPKSVVTKTDTVIDRTVETVIPTIIHHKPISKTKRYELGRRLRLTLQLLLAVLPFIICVALPPSNDLPRYLSIAVAGSFMAASILGFLIAWSVAPKQRKTTSRTRSRASRE